MSAEPAPRPIGSTAGPQKAAWQTAANVVIRGLLRTPLLHRALSNLLITLYVVGRTSGRRYAIPVAYARHEGRLLVGTSAAWAHNFRTGQTVSAQLRGRRRQLDAEVLTDRSSVTESYEVIIRHNKNFARFNGITFDADGRPDPEDLHRVWATGARVIRLTPAP